MIRDHQVVSPRQNRSVLRDLQQLSENVQFGTVGPNCNELIFVLAYFQRCIPKLALSPLKRHLKTHGSQYKPFEAKYDGTFVDAF
jgi:hypothetical protein